MSENDSSEPGRRAFIQRALGLLAIAPLSNLADAADPPAPLTRRPPTPMEDGMTSDTWFRISLAQWSLHRTIRAGELDPMDFAAHTKERYGLDAIEYVNSFYREQAADEKFPLELRTRADDAGVSSLLIMIDGEGPLGSPDTAERQQAVENHRRWLDIAAALGCHSIRVNANSTGTPDEQLALCAEGMSNLLRHADEVELNVLIENHGGHSSNGAWLSNLMRKVDHPRFGTLPDFGNFILDWDTREEYDRYTGVTELMPFAKAVSAKSNAFNEDGDEIGTDYERMLGIVKNAGYRGWIGIEYEGGAHGEHEGIEHTRDLLLRLGGSR